MTILHKHGVVPAQGLSTEELAEIKQLAHLCNTYEKLDLKLNWNTLAARPEDQTNDFLYYEHGLLVGYLPIFSFNSREAEISGMVHPEQRRKGIFTTLFQAAYAECQRRKLAILLLIVEHSSVSGQAFARSLAPGYDHSEYKMVLVKPEVANSFDPQLQFRSATLEDATAMKQITGLAFNIPVQEVDWYTAQELEHERRRFYVADLVGVTIGKLDVSLDGDHAMIYGFGVLPEYRRRGYGRQILAQTIAAIYASGQQHISLEVATENEHALGLYQSCGFTVTGRYDYYRVDLPKA